MFIKKKQIYFSFQYINESSAKFVQNVSNLISKNVYYIKCLVFQKGRNFLSYFSPKIKEFDKDTFTAVYGIPCYDCSQCYIGETTRALTLRLTENLVNCHNQKQHLAVVDHSAINH